MRVLFKVDTIAQVKDVFLWEDLHAAIPHMRGRGGFQKQHCLAFVFCLYYKSKVESFKAAQQEHIFEGEC